MTLRGRIETGCAIVGATIFGILMLVALLWLVGNGVDHLSEYYTARDACLKRATNGYAIEQCR